MSDKIKPHHLARKAILRYPRSAAIRWRPNGWAYMAAARENPAGTVNHPGSDGASIAQPGARYGPQSPKGFLNATPVIIVGQQERGAMTDDDGNEYRNASRAFVTLSELTEKVGFARVLALLVGIARREAETVSEKAAADEEFAIAAAFDRVRAALDGMEQRAREALASKPAKPLPPQILAIFKRDRN